MLPAGPVTEYDVIRILPFGGKVLTADIRGSLLARALDQGIASHGTGAFLQTANVSIGDGGTWAIGGKTLDPARMYRIAINDFLASGKEQGMDFLKPGPDLTVVKENRDVAHGGDRPAPPRVPGLSVVESRLPQEYALLSMNGEPCAKSCPRRLDSRSCHLKRRST